MKDQRTAKSIEHLAQIGNVVEFVYASELFYLPWTLALFTKWIHTEEIYDFTATNRKKPLKNNFFSKFIPRVATTQRAEVAIMNYA